MKKLIIILVVLGVLFSVTAADKFTANITLEKDWTGEAKLSSLSINFETMLVKTIVDLLNWRWEGTANILTLYQSLNAEEKPVVLKFFKMMVAATFNDATGKSYTWNQVPNTIFQVAE